MLYNGPTGPLAHTIQVRQNSARSTVPSQSVRYTHKRKLYAMVRRSTRPRISSHSRASQQRRVPVFTLRMRYISRHNQITVAMECPICFEQTELVTLQCSHSICQPCGDVWFSKATTCPTCRSPVVTCSAVQRILTLVFPDIPVPMSIIYSCMKSIKVSILSPTITQLAWTYNKTTRIIIISNKPSEILHTKVSKGPQPSVESIACACIASTKQTCCIICALSSRWECIHDTFENISL